MVDMPGIEAALKALRENYIAQLPNKIGDIEQRWIEQRTATVVSDAAKDLLRLIHSMAGSGSSFGFAVVSERARELELYYTPFVKQGKLLSPDDIKEFDRLCQQLRQVIDDIVDHPQTSPAPVEGAIERCEVSSPVVVMATTEPVVCRRPLYLVDDDELLARTIAGQLEHYGYSVQVFTDPQLLTSAIRHQLPEAILMDMSFPGANGAQIIAYIRAQMAISVPVVFISGHSDQEARLAAVRAGGDDYLTKPVNIGVLVDKLDRLTRRVPSEPHRVLVVNSEHTVLNGVKHSLRQAGIEVNALNRPEKTMEMMTHFHPELLLLGVSMQYCSGIELARVIRQTEQYLDLPIVFLANPEEEHLTQDAIRFGGDDFLTCPVSDMDLISVVRSRVDRYRMMRRALEQDGLTGLLNHSRFTDALLQEFGRSRRYGSEFCFVMLDIDFFKKVNDTYGHPVGDEVLRSLSRLMKQRLRKTDVIGRLGGEEFGVIMVNARLDDARHKIDDLRREFSAMEHSTALGIFHSSFSAGISAFPVCADVKSLVDSADKALYQAKAEGRNQVSIL